MRAKWRRRRRRRRRQRTLLLKWHCSDVSPQAHSCEGGNWGSRRGGRGKKKPALRKKKWSPRSSEEIWRGRKKKSPRLGKHHPLPTHTYPLSQAGAEEWRLMLLDGAPRPIYGWSRLLWGFHRAIWCPSAELPPISPNVFKHVPSGESLPCKRRLDPIRFDASHGGSGALMHIHEDRDPPTSYANCMPCTRPAQAPAHYT